MITRKSCGTTSVISSWEILRSTSIYVTVPLCQFCLKSEQIAFHRHGSTSVWISVFSTSFFVLVFKCTANLLLFKLFVDCIYACILFTINAGALNSTHNNCLSAQINPTCDTTAIFVILKSFNFIVKFISTFQEFGIIDEGSTGHGFSGKIK